MLECYKCGNFNDTSNAVCSKCGKDLNDEITDNLIASNNKGYDWIVLKIAFGAIFVLCAIIFSIYLVCCSGDKNSKKEESLKIADDKIWIEMTRKAKTSAYNPLTYEFQSQKNYKLNDSVSLFVQIFSSENDYGVSKEGVVIGFFNINTGYELDGSDLEYMTSERELNNSLLYIKNKNQ